MSCGEPGYDRRRAPSTGVDPGSGGWEAVVSSPMVFTLTAFAFAVGALILFIFAFRAVFAGKIGSAVVFALVGLALSGAAGATAVAA
jgi:hypothetical protein